LCCVVLSCLDLPVVCYGLVQFDESGFMVKRMAFLS
jgi:hypothetical protein